MKKIISFLLSLVMVVCVFGAMPIYAAQKDAQLYLSNESAVANDKVEVTLSAKNFSSVAAAEIQIDLGGLSFISLQSAFVKSGDYSVKNGIFKYVAFDTALNNTTSIFGNTDNEVTVCKFTFKVSATAKKNAVLDIQFIDACEFIDADNNDVEVSLTKGTVTVTGDAKAQGKAPRPTVKSKTETTIVLNSVAGCEYSKDGTNWQTSTTFKNLSVNTAYKFYQRYAEKQGGYIVGQSSDALSVATNNHTYEDVVVTKATTSKNGKSVKMCSACGKPGTTTTLYYAKTVKLNKTSFTYTGKTIKHPTVVIKDSKGKTISSKYYTVTKAKGLKNIGKYKVTVKFKGNYSGTKPLYFTINPKLKLSATKYTYDGKTKKPSIKVTNSSGKKISTKYYTESYSSGRKKVGKYTVTIKFKNGHSGTYKETFTIVPKSTSVSKLTAAKKSLKVSIKKQSSQTTGYEIQYSTSKKFTNAKTATIKSYKTTSTTLKSLSAKKTYYVRVRTYKTIGKTKYYSGWSSAKSKKTK